MNLYAIVDEFGYEFHGLGSEDQASEYRRNHRDSSVTKVLDWNTVRDGHDLIICIGSNNEEQEAIERLED